MWIREFEIGLMIGLLAWAGRGLAQERDPAAPPAPIPAASTPPAVTPAPIPSTQPAVPVPASPPRATLPPADIAIPTSPGVPGIITPKFQPQSVTVTMLNGNTMSGTLGEVDQWAMKTSLGTTNVPVSAVAGVRMAQEGNATTTVVLHNGDSITGALQLDHVTIETDWGKAQIFGTHVTSILFTPGLKWTSEAGLNGTRWKLVTDESRTPPPAPTPVSSSPATTTSTTTSTATPAAAQPVRATNVSGPPRVVVPIRGRP